MAESRSGLGDGEDSFAARLKALRGKAGLTQAQLAHRAGLHLGAVFKIEQGKREPTWETVQALAEALGTNCLAFQTKRLKTPKPKPEAEAEAPAPKRPARRKRKGD
jgi:transcriptional regulator with XRE-family HTH domain